MNQILMVSGFEFPRFSGFKARVLRFLGTKRVRIWTFLSFEEQNFRSFKVSEFQYFLGIKVTGFRHFKVDRNQMFMVRV
jgi:hypothetical protein